LAETVLVEYFCLNEQRKLVLTAFQLALSVLKVSKLSRQDWARPLGMLANSWTFFQSSQVAMVAANLTIEESASGHGVLGFISMK
jgi:hypothetical protein